MKVAFALAVSHHMGKMFVICTTLSHFKNVKVVFGCSKQVELVLSPLAAGKVKGIFLPELNN